MQLNNSLIQLLCVDVDFCLDYSLDGNNSYCKQYLSDDSHTLIVALISNPKYLIETGMCD